MCKETKDVRVVIENGKLWFVAKDLCVAGKLHGADQLAKRHTYDVVKKIPESMKRLMEIKTQGGVQKMIMVDIDGACRLVKSFPNVLYRVVA